MKQKFQRIHQVATITVAFTMLLIWIDSSSIELCDLDIDIIIEGNGPTYRMIDLEEFGDALVANERNIVKRQVALHRLQQFLDEHLHGSKDFPPTSIRPFMS